MSGVIHNLLNQASRIIRSNLQKKNTNILTKIWYGPGNTFHETSEKQMTEILSKRFPKAVNIKVEDVSGGCGAMYEIYVETNEFKGLSVVKQHRSVYDALKDQIKHIHGLQVVTKIPP